MTFRIRYPDSAYANASFVPVKVGLDNSGGIYGDMVFGVGDDKYAAYDKNSWDPVMREKVSVIELCHREADAAVKYARDMEEHLRVSLNLPRNPYKFDSLGAVGDFEGNNSKYVAPKPLNILRTSKKINPYDSDPIVRRRILFNRAAAVERRRLFLLGRGCYCKKCDQGELHGPTKYCVGMAKFGSLKDYLNSERESLDVIPKSVKKRYVEFH